MTSPVERQGSLVEDWILRILTVACVLACLFGLVSLVGPILLWGSTCGGDLWR